MPKAILALRSYPLAILMALVLFVCSLLIATSSIGTIGGGDDSGSGMGGTGRSGGFGGDSGFGGTGGPSPFLGSSDAVEDRDAEDIPADSLIEPFLQQQQETARIPEDMQPLIELQRTAPQRPDYQDETPSLDVLNDDSQELPPHVRRLLDMADAGNDATIVEPTLEIQIQIPETTGTRNIERFRLEVAEPAAPLPFPDADSSLNTDLDTNPETEAEQLANDGSSESQRPLIPERIQRPELPPFQRMRPAVDRASIAPPRPRPMHI